jgi:hypothetical protein
MPIPDKTAVMASSSTEFQWLAGKTKLLFNYFAI